MTDELETRADKLARIQVIRAEIDRLTEEYEGLRDEAVVPMEGPELIVGADGKKYRVSPVSGSQPNYRNDRLNELTEEERALVTETKIIGARLKDALEKDLIPIEKAARLVSYSGKKPYPKFDPIPE
jgi:hypothetical protein